MMYKNWSLGKFFLCAFFLFAALAAFVLYGWRTNAPGNIWDEQGQDVSAPYYDKSHEEATKDAHGHGDGHGHEAENPAHEPKAGEPDHEKDDHGHGH
jgi:hypothetical protein